MKLIIFYFLIFIFLCQETFGLTETEFDEVYHQFHHSMSRLVWKGSDLDTSIDTPVRRTLLWIDILVEKKDQPQKT